MSNYSHLETNIIDSLQSHEAKTAFVRALDKTQPMKAELFANEVDELVSFLDPTLYSAALINNLETVPSGLLKFILDRHYHCRFPQVSA